MRPLQFVFGYNHYVFLVYTGKEETEVETEEKETFCLVPAYDSVTVS